VPACLGRLSRPSWARHSKPFTGGDIPHVRYFVRQHRLSECAKSKGPALICRIAIHLITSMCDPNEVVVLQDVSDVAKARTWLGSDDMKAAMQKSGVIGSPSIRFAA
jgi:hypothetical protein